MTNPSDSNKASFAGVLGGLSNLIIHEFGAAVATIGGLWVGFACLHRAQIEGQWPLYLVGGGIFVAVLVVCRWHGRA